MTASTAGLRRPRSLSAEDFLRAVPFANRAMTIVPASDGGALASIPMNRPRWLVPPLSWMLPYSSQRRVRLDAVGCGVLGLCDGNRNIETIIEEFARANKLSFREAQLPTTQFLKQMTERGIIVVVGFPASAAGK